MLNKDFCGECELKDLAKGVYFKIVTKKGLSKEVYIKSYYERSEKKYQCDKFSDYLGNGRMLKGSTKVSTDFIF